ncbi:hypothetical protein ABIE89_000395 [Bradyrhizobium niftali]
MQARNMLFDCLSGLSRDHRPDFGAEANDAGDRQFPKHAFEHGERAVGYALLQAKQA